MIAPLSGVDLNLLVALDALLTDRNVTRAAERMSLGQPAMSAALSRLRKQLGDPLLVREGRGYVLTTLAESLVAPVQEALAAAEAILGVRKGFEPASDDRTFSIVATDYVALVLLRPMLAELANEAPNVRIHVLSLGSGNADRLRRGTEDLLIFPTDLAGSFGDLPHSVLFKDRFVLAADRDNPDGGGAVSLDGFGELPYLAVRGSVPSLVESQLDFLGIPREPAVTTQSFVIIPMMLTGTRLVALVQERLAAPLADHANLRLMEPPFPLRPIVEAMFWSQRSTDDPGHRWLRSRLLDQARRI